MIVGMQKKAEKAAKVAALLKSLGHPRRLMILCYLSNGALGVSALQDRMGLGQAAVSQQLARLRMEGLVVGDKRGQRVEYRLADEKISAVLRVLAANYCKELLA
jgi:ArsR family transcriptional regulator